MAIDTQQPELVSQVEADQDGDWEAIVPTSVSDGLHRVEAIDELGNFTTSLLFVERPQGEPSTVSVSTPTIVERILPSVPPEFAYALFLFILIVLALALNGVRLARKADIHDRHTNHRKSYLGAVAAAIAAILISLAIGVALNKTVGVIQRFLPHQEAVPVKLSIAGTLKAPFGGPVAGADLVAGDTRIRTDAGGQFAFEGIDAGTGIRVTHPLVARPVVYAFPDEDGPVARMFPVDLWFDAAVLNLVSAVIDLDARSLEGDLYQFLATDAQKAMDAGSFIASYPSSFEPKEVGMQELRVVSAKTLPTWTSSATGVAFKQIFELTIEHGTSRVTYRLIKEGDSWRLAW